MQIEFSLVFMSLVQAAILTWIFSVFPCIIFLDFFKICILKNLSYSKTEEKPSVAISDRSISILTGTTRQSHSFQSSYSSQSFLSVIPIFPVIPVLLVIFSLFMLFLLSHFIYICRMIMTFDFCHSLLILYPVISDFFSITIRWLKGVRGIGRSRFNMLPYFFLSFCIYENCQDLDPVISVTHSLVTLSYLNFLSL